MSRIQQIAAYRTTGPAAGMLAGDRSRPAGRTMPGSSATRGTAHQAHRAGLFAGIWLVTMSPEPGPPPGAAPVTATVTRRVRPGHGAACEEALAGIGGAAGAFPGYLGEEAFRPAGGGSRIVYRFDSPARAAGWTPASAVWLARAKPHVADPMRTQVLTGLEGWITLPRSPARPAATRPSFLPTNWAGAAWHQTTTCG
jgi:hypothetical protein